MGSVTSILQYAVYLTENHCNTIPTQMLNLIKFNWSQAINLWVSFLSYDSYTWRMASYLYKHVYALMAHTFSHTVSPSLKD